MQNFENATYSTDGCIDIDGVKTSYTQLCNFDSLVAFWFASEIQEMNLAEEVHTLQRK